MLIAIKYAGLFVFLPPLAFQPHPLDLGQFPPDLVQQKNRSPGREAAQIKNKSNQIKKAVCRAFPPLGVGAVAASSKQIPPLELFLP